MAPPRKSGRKALKTVKYDAAPAAAKSGNHSLSSSPANSTTVAPAIKGKTKHTKRKGKARPVVTPEPSSSSHYSSSDEDSTLY